MNGRTYQELYEYVFGDKSNLDAKLEKTPLVHKEKQKEKLKLNLRNFFINVYNTHKLKSLLKEVSIKSFNPLVDAENEKKLRDALKDTKHNLNEFNSLITAENKEDFVNILNSIGCTHLIAALFPTGISCNQQTDYCVDKDIADNFASLNNEFHFFNADSKEVLASYKICFALVKLIGKVIEKDVRSDRLDYEYAYKILVYFGENNKKIISTLDTFIKIHNYSAKKRPLHDICMYTLPSNFAYKINLEKWRRLILNSGTRALKLFTHAEKIEKYLNCKAPSSLAEAREAFKLLSYSRAKEDLSLADLFSLHEMSEENFNQALSIKMKRKTKDNLPNITIYGDEHNPLLRDYVFCKLPIDDDRAFVLGKLTDCCQWLGGWSSECVIDGITRENNAFYVLMKKTSRKISEPDEKTNIFNTDRSINYTNYKIVGQGYAWISKNHNLTIDSWENRRPLIDDKIIVNFLNEFAKKVIEQNRLMLRVTIGRGGKTPNKEYKTVLNPEKQLEGEQYEDSNNQFLVGCNTELTKEYERNIKSELMTMLGSIHHPFLNSTIFNPEILSDFYFLLIKLLKIEEVRNFIQLENGLFRFFKASESLYDLPPKITANLNCGFKSLAEAPKKINEVIARCEHALLCYAAEFEDSARLKKCLAYVEIGNINLKYDAHHILPLVHAKNSTNAQILLNAGAQLDITLGDNLNSIMQTIIDNYELPITDEKQDKQAMIQTLLEHKGHLGYANKRGFTALSTAVYRSDLALTQLLIDKKADLNVTTHTGDSLLHLAVNSNQPAIVKLLINLKANLNLKNLKGETPLHIIAQRIYHAEPFNFLKLLVDAKAELNHQDELGLTPLHHLSATKYLPEQSCADYLIKNRANLNIQSKKGITPLHLIMGKHFDDNCLSFLIKYKADFNICDQDGLNPLNKNIDNYCFKEIDPRKLVEAKADIFAKSSGGRAVFSSFNSAWQSILLFGKINRVDLLWLKDRFSKIEKTYKFSTVIEHMLREIEFSVNVEDEPKFFKNEYYIYRFYPIVADIIIKIKKYIKYRDIISLSEKSDDNNCCIALVEILQEIETRLAKFPLPDFEDIKLLFNNSPKKSSQFILIAR